MPLAHPATPTAEPYLADDPRPPLPWEVAVEQLGQGSTCWFVTTSPDGRPHTVPVLAVVADGAVHVAADPHSRKATHLAHDPRATVATHADQLDLVVEGTTEPITDDARLAAVASAYADTHGWQVDVHDGALHGEGAPTAGPGPYRVHRLHPTRALGFPTAGDLTPTRWRFPGG